jgi:WD40 repeat protein
MQEDLGVVTRIGAGFSQSGDLVMGSTRSDNRAGGKEPREHVGGVLLWNTNTGALASCVEAPCPNRPPSDLSALPTLVGASLAPDASLVLIYNELGVIRVNLPDLKYEQVYDNMSPGIPSSDVTTIGLVTFDATGMRYAVGLEEGAVAVVPIQQPWWAFLRNPLVLGKNDQSDLKTIADIAFSPDGSWLAEARRNTLRVWNLSAPSSTKSFQVPLPHVFHLAFDQSSMYLYAADGRSVVVVDLDAGAVVGRLDTPGISAATVSPDNRLLFWGDVNGVVHVQGDCGG